MGNTRVVVMPGMGSGMLCLACRYTLILAHLLQRGSLFLVKGKPRLRAEPGPQSSEATASRLCPWGIVRGQKRLGPEPVAPYWSHPSLGLSFSSSSPSCWGPRGCRQAKEESQPDGALKAAVR